jgi:hypothetical protein
METRPPEMIAKLVRALVPPASREHVLGDLQERYVSPRGYLADALRTIPFIIASRLRRTTQPLVALLFAGFLWFGVFWGNQQASVYAALIPTLITLAVLALRDVYRGATPTWPRAAALDVGLAAAVVLIGQAILFLAAPALVLTRDTLMIGFPLGFLILFGARLQIPGGFHQPPASARSLSMAELRTEIAVYENTIRRAVRVEMVACAFVAIFFCGFLWSPAPLIAKIGAGVTAVSAAFIYWFLRRFARIDPVASNLGFAESIAAYRRELERRQWLSKTYVWWYVLPLMTGMALMIVGPQLLRAGSSRGALITTLVLVGFGVLLVLLQKSVAQKARLRADQLVLVNEKTLSA